MRAAVPFDVRMGSVDGLCRRLVAGAPLVRVSARRGMSVGCRRHRLDRVSLTRTKLFVPEVDWVVLSC